MRSRPVGVTGGNVSGRHSQLATHSHIHIHTEHTNRIVDTYHERTHQDPNGPKQDNTGDKVGAPQVGKAVLQIERLEPKVDVCCGCGDFGDGKGEWIEAALR